MARALINVSVTIASSPTKNSPYTDEAAGRDIEMSTKNGIASESTGNKEKAFEVRAE